MSLLTYFTEVSYVNRDLQYVFTSQVCRVKTIETCRSLLTYLTQVKYVFTSVKYVSRDLDMPQKRRAYDIKRDVQMRWLGHVE